MVLTSHKWNHSFIRQLSWTSKVRVGTKREAADVFLETKENVFGQENMNANFPVQEGWKQQSMLRRVESRDNREWTDPDPVEIRTCFPDNGV